MKEHAYAISAGHEVTVEAAKSILDAGGNAVDAAIAAFVTSWVTEPAMASAGGGAFALVAMNNKPVRAFDFFCQTPINKRPLNEIQYLPVLVDFGDAQETYYIGAGSSAVPGSVAGIYAMHEHFGYMPMQELLLPAINAANKGVILNAFQRLDLTLLKEVFALTETGRKLFQNEKGVLPVGSKVANPDLGSFLDVLRYEGQDLFYKGEIAKGIEDQHQSLGGLLTRNDLNKYQVHVSEPLPFNFQGRELYTMPFPSAGGAILNRILEEFEVGRHSEMRLHSEDHLRSIYETFVGLDHFKKDLDQLFLKNTKSPNTSKINRRGSTSHLNVLDKTGNGVSLTMTIGEGCGLYIPGTGIHMNNMLGEESLQPEGLHTWKTDVRLNSMMAPSIVVGSNGDEKLLLGTGGASRIPFMLSQVIDNVYHFNIPVKEAIEIPRIHFEHGVLQFEASKHHGFKARNDHNVKHWQDISLFFGGVHAIHMKSNHVEAYGDRRRDGCEFIGS